MAEPKDKSDDVFVKPQCLIYTDETGKMRISKGIIEQIKKVEEEKQLNAIAIAGQYRTGKSYLMSRLAGETRGFPLGATVDSKTKGIWVWCRPHPQDNQQVLLLMDSEGIGDISKGDADHDNKIFTLVTLMSSTLIYNAMGVLSQDMFDKLNFITNISQNIKASNTSSGDADLDKYFPKLILALRDQTLELGDNYKTPDEYFEYHLSTSKGDDKDTEKKNRPKLCIRKYFTNRTCFMFDRPGDRKVLQQLEDMEDKDLDKLFVKETNRFLKYVFERCEPKTMQNGKVINGRIFGNMLQSYVDSINDGKVPCIESTFMSMAIIENKKAVESAVQLYHQNMKDFVLPVAEYSTLTSAHLKYVKLSEVAFLKTAFMDVKFLEEAQKKMMTVFQQIEMKNETASSTNCKKLLQKLYKPIKKAIQDNKYTVSGGYKEYQQEMKNLKDKYNCNEEGIILGVKKEEALQLFLKDKLKEGKIIMFADKNLKEKEKMLEQQKRKSAEQNAELQKKAAQREKDFVKMMEKRHRQQIEEYAQSMEKNLNKNKKILQARYDEEERRKNEEHKKKDEKLQGEIRTLKEENERKQKEIQDMREPKGESVFQKIANSFRKWCEEHQEALANMTPEEYDRHECDWMFAVPGF